MDFRYLHEVELVEFLSDHPRPLSELVPIFTALGFTVHDDVVSLDRSGRIPPWQHSSLVEVEVLRDGEELFGFEEGEWDTIQLKYLFASLPFEKSVEFLNTVEAIAKALAIVPRYRGSETDVSTLSNEFERIRDELLTETGEDPGSEGLAILIHSTYPRR